VDIATSQEIRSIPKVELHVHFGGSVAPATAIELAKRHGLDAAAVLPLEDGRYPAAYEGFEQFLRTLIAVHDLIRTPDDVEMVAAAFAREQAAQGIVYSEVIVTARSHVLAGVEPRELWAALRAGFGAAGDATRVAIIVDAIRDLGPDDLRETMGLVERADAPIVGIGLTGTEGTWPTSDFAWIRREADDLGLGVEIHAGEMGPPESIWASLDVLGADRIGHGAAAIRDPKLVARLVREQVPLDVCPTSNVRIGLYPSLEEHPVRRFLEAGVNVNISSDDPPYFGVTLLDEIQNVVRVAKLDRAGLVELQLRAARAAFLPEAERRALEGRIRAWADAVADRSDGRWSA
jgi:adenosine deaminase